MSINGFKGSLYDLLGYFAPGLVAVIGATLFKWRICNDGVALDALKTISKSISAFEVFVLIIIAYVLGHAIASISSFLIEKRLVVRVKKLREILSDKGILGDEHYVSFCAKYKNVFNAQYNEKSIRKVICYVQSKQSYVYETALIFLSFYGMARNFSFTFGTLFFLEAVLCIVQHGSILVAILFVFLSALFLYEYIRFRKYFMDTILSGFLIPEKNL